MRPSPMRKGVKLLRRELPQKEKISPSFVSTQPVPSALAITCAKGRGVPCATVRLRPSAAKAKRGSLGGSGGNRWRRRESARSRISGVATGGTPRRRATVSVATPMFFAQPSTMMSSAEPVGPISSSRRRLAHGSKP
ncbi:hypothetical protein [Methylocystis parvus]|uniref:hypothetical protein n=1 Tax=Methylocystis parvus TaxID=134 RepID=UPI003C792A4E